MSEECCGPDEPRKTSTVRRIELSRPLTTGDACCGPDDTHTTADTHMGAREHEDGDACCGPDPASPVDTDAEEVEVRPPWWRDTALLPSAIAGVFLLAGYILEWTGVPIPAMILQAIALIAGAYTFVPGAVRRLLRGRLGVGLLMTIAAVGAVLLGHVGEAAALAFLFSLAEALEDRAMDRAKEGLRALLSLIPDTVRVSRLGGDVTIPAADVRELEILVVGAGERIATDGVVVEGQSSLDTSAVIGRLVRRRSPALYCGPRPPRHPCPFGAELGAGRYRPGLHASSSRRVARHPTREWSPRHRALRAGVRRRCMGSIRVLEN